MKGLSMIALVSLPLLAGCRSSSSITATSAPAANVANAYPKPSPDRIKKMLTPLQFEVTQNAATEPPFSNAYWNNHEAGIYVDVVTGQPLFSSADKFESGTGWPSFTRPIEDGVVISKSDETHGMDRKEVRSSSGDSHLGHVFDDGPAPTNMRYCINSASLRFVPTAKLDVEGYGQYGANVTGSRIAPSTSNSCAKPAPGEKPGCNTTLGIAIVYGDVADAMKKRAGVLQVERGSVDGSVATRVIYDPKALDGKSLGRAFSGDESTFKPVH